MDYTWSGWWGVAKRKQFWNLRIFDFSNLGMWESSNFTNLEYSNFGIWNFRIPGRPRVDPGKPGVALGRPRVVPGRPWVGPDLECFRGADFKVDLETIIIGRSMPWSFGCTKRRPERMKLKLFYSFARLTGRGLVTAGPQKELRGNQKNHLTRAQVMKH